MQTVDMFGWLLSRLSSRLLLVSGEEQPDHGVCLPVLEGAVAPVSFGDQQPVLAGVDQ